ncbi:uncharacterized protein LOC128682600 [Plodia interpunctella]|uniref:uncharacterized protein LOC128682600 n=1 Tax=Plodia interpunctella TaxID=58824 RepID=UPI002368EA61|nr:uncharacterized protein LOC128682600 [Plodia interpunctella]
MSHTVTITRTTAVSSGNTGNFLYINSGYASTLPGLLKLAQLLLSAACVGVMTYYYDHGSKYLTRAELFFLLVAVAFLIGTFCLYLSYLISLSSATMISKTVFEVIYHGLGFILYLAAGITLLTEVNHYKRSSTYEAYLAASIMGLILAGLYLLSTVFANRSFRSL